MNDKPSASPVSGDGRTRVRKPLPPSERAVLKPRDVERLFDITAPTRWRWEKKGKLPPRDVILGGEPIGWRPATLGITP
jgi:predicted DNA-binding transcriptional regulator AlpA